MARSESNHPTYPPAPWTLRGEAVGISRLVDRSVAERYVPPELMIVSIWPGKTLGGMLLAKYGRGSTLEYHELIVFCGIVRRGTRLGAWISHIYVDSPASVAGGREIWGLPKELADYGDIDETYVSRNGGRFLQFTRRAGRLKVPLPLWLPAWGKLGNCLIRFSARGRGRVGLGYSGWEVAPESPLADVLRSGMGFCITVSGLRITDPNRRTSARRRPSRCAETGVNSGRATGKEVS